MLYTVCSGNKYSLELTFFKGFAKFYLAYKSSIIEKEFKKVFIDKATKTVTQSCFSKIKDHSINRHKTTLQIELHLK